MPRNFCSLAKNNHPDSEINWRLVAPSTSDEKGFPGWDQINDRDTFFRELDLQVDSLQMNHDAMSRVTTIEWWFSRGIRPKYLLGKSRVCEIYFFQLTRILVIVIGKV